MMVLVEIIITIKSSLSEDNNLLLGNRHNKHTLPYVTSC